MARFFRSKQGKVSRESVPTSGDRMMVESCARIAAASDVKGLIAALRETARAVVGSDGITVIRRDGDEVVYVTEDAISPLWAGWRFAIRECVSGMAIQANAAIAIPDISVDPRVPLNAYLATFVRSMIVVPVGRPTPTMAIGAYWQVPGPIATLAAERLAILADAAGDALARIDGTPARDRQQA